MLGRTLALVVVVVFVDSNSFERPWAVCSKGHRQYFQKAMGSMFDIVVAGGNAPSETRRQGTVARGKARSEARHGRHRQGTVGGKASSPEARHRRRQGTGGSPGARHGQRQGTVARGNALPGATVRGNARSLGARQQRRAVDSLSELVETLHLYGPNRGGHLERTNSTRNSPFRRCQGFDSKRTGANIPDSMTTGRCMSNCQQ